MESGGRSLCRRFLSALARMNASSEAGCHPPLGRGSTNRRGSCSALPFVGLPSCCSGTRRLRWSPDVGPLSAFLGCGTLRTPCGYLPPAFKQSYPRCCFPRIPQRACKSKPLRISPSPAKSIPHLTATSPRSLFGKFVIELGRHGSSQP